MSGQTPAGRELLALTAYAASHETTAADALLAWRKEPEGERAKWFASADAVWQTLVGPIERAQSDSASLRQRLDQADRTIEQQRVMILTLTGPAAAPKAITEDLAQPQPAPELAAAMAETRAVRGAVNEMMRMFHGIPGGYGARTSIVRLRRIAETAGVTPPQPGDPLSTVIADELALLQDHIGTLAAGLKLSASSSSPSKKSEIETSIANALLALLDPR